MISNESEGTDKTKPKKSGPNKGRKFSEETRRRMSEARKGRVISEETRRKQRESNLGKKHKFTEESKEKLKSNLGKKASEETRQKLREKRKGRVFSEETRRKIAEANRRRKVSEETKQKLRLANLGKVPSEETRRKIAEANTGRKFGPIPETRRRKISEAQKGNSYRKGIPLTEEHKQKLRDFRTGKKLSEETKQKISKANKGRVLSEEFRKRNSILHRGKTISEEHRKRVSEAHKGIPLTEEHKQRIREATIKNDTPEWRAKLSDGVKRAYERPDFKARNYEILTSPDVKEKARLSKVGIPLSQEHKEKIAKASQQSQLRYWSSKTLEERQELTLKMRQASELTVISSLEVFVKGILDKLGISYEQQKPIGKYYKVDFFLLDYGVVLECYGCYWHFCTICNKKMGNRHRRNKRNDRGREAYLRACGYQLLILWEHDIKLAMRSSSPEEWLADRLSLAR